MLASHALVLLGVPLRRVVRRIRDVREHRYSLMRGFFHGGTDEAEDPDEAREPRLHSVTLATGASASGRRDRKSTRLNSSHTVISYAVFCLKKKKDWTHRESRD